MGKLVRYLKVVEPKALGVEGGFLFIMPALPGLVLLSEPNFCPLKNVYSRKRICVLFYKKIGFGRHITTFEKTPSVSN